jgi:16S rRNA processing protein RimM
VKPEPPASEWLLIGRIVGLYGWAGAVKVWPETDFPERFKQLKSALLEFPDGRRQTVQVLEAKVQPRQIWLQFAEYSAKEFSRELIGAQILIPAEQAKVLPEGEYYMHQILGLKVQDSEGRDLGPITEVLRAPAHDVYVTPLADIPARKEVVKQIDLERGIMLVKAGAYVLTEKAPAKSDANEQI